MQAQEPENFTQICLKIITGGTKLILYVYFFFLKMFYISMLRNLIHCNIYFH